MSGTQSHLEKLPGVARRFLDYVRIDTRSDPDSRTTPSSPGQRQLGALLVDELKTAGIRCAEVDEFGYVYATIPAVAAIAAPTIGLLAHMDTSPDEPGDARPIVHFEYDGSVIKLPGADVDLDPTAFPALKDHIGHDVITGDGSTLLGSDDKAGVAIIMQLVEDLLRRDTPRPELRICFTVDEEIGRGVDRLDLSRFAARLAYTIDGGGSRMIYSETFNAAEAIISIDGVMVHPGYAKDIMVNALRILGDLLYELPPDEAPETTDDRAGYIHPYSVERGDPAHIVLKLILRDFSNEGLQFRKQFLQSLVSKQRRRHPRGTIRLTISDQYRNMRSYIDELDPRVVTFAHAAAREVGIELEERPVRGGTDGARLSELGIPTPNLFTGGYNFHSRFEWNTVQNLEESLQYLKALVRYWAANGHRE